MEKQKQMDKLDRIAYYPGCSLNSTAIDFNASTKRLLDVMNIKWEEIKDWNCCGTSPAHNTSEELPVALSARNLLIAKNMGYEKILSPCVSCYSRLVEASRVLSNTEEIDNIKKRKLRNNIFGILNDMGFKPDKDLNFRIYSLVEFLYLKKEVIQKKYNQIKHDVRLVREKAILDKLKPVCYYGCILLRPQHVIKFDNPEDPIFMEKILEKVDIHCNNFQFKTECCGAILSLTHKDVVLRLTRDILDEALNSNANSIIVCCQLCQQNLDLRQSQINRRYKKNYNLPVFYITQILGLALGLTYREVMIDRLFVEPKQLIKN